MDLTGSALRRFRPPRVVGVNGFRDDQSTDKFLGNFGWTVPLGGPVSRGEIHAPTVVCRLTLATHLVNAHVFTHFCAGALYSPPLWRLLVLRL